MKPEIWLFITIISSIILGFCIAMSIYAPDVPGLYVNYGKGIITNHSQIETINVSSFTIHIMNDSEINRKYKELGGKKKTHILGFENKKTREIYVRYSNKIDMNNKTMPDLETLGHEIYHLEELGGNWHA